jgi:hypothetical protein
VSLADVPLGDVPLGEDALGDELPDDESLPQPAMASDAMAPNAMMARRAGGRLVLLTMFSPSDLWSRLGFADVSASVLGASMRLTSLPQRCR